jgi:cytoskeletal protein RodZ
MSLEAIASATKIGIHFLTAIEAEQFEKLPGGVYNTSYIRQYAQFTGIDELAILARYVEFLESADAATVPPELGASRFEYLLSRIKRLLRKHKPSVVGAQQGPILKT